MVVDAVDYKRLTTIAMFWIFMVMLDQLLNRTTFIVGNKKNAGKTTFLNYLLGHLRQKTRVAYLSIGVDGETADQIFGFEKPRVVTEKDDIVVTSETALKHTAATYEVLEKFPYQTVLGRPVLVRVKNGGAIELIGPENNSQLSVILNNIKKKAKVDTILVDGAINRNTQVSSIEGAAFVYIARVEKWRLLSAVEDIKRIFELSKCRSLQADQKEILSIRGALTSARGEKIGKDIKIVVVDDFTKVFLDYRELLRFKKEHRLCYKTDFDLLSCVVNLIDVGQEEFLAALSDKKLEKRIVFNPMNAKFL